MLLANPVQQHKRFPSRIASGLAFTYRAATAVAEVLAGSRT